MKWTLKREKPFLGLQCGSITCAGSWVCDTLEFDNSPVIGYLNGDIYYHLAAGNYTVKNEWNKLRNEKLPAIIDESGVILSWLVYRNVYVFKNIILRELNDWVTIGRTIGINEIDNQENAINRLIHEIDKINYRNEIIELEIIYI